MARTTVTSADDRGVTEGAEVGGRNGRPPLARSVSGGDDRDVIGLGRQVLCFCNLGK